MNRPSFTSKMSKRIEANQPFLQLLARSGSKRRKALLQHATKDELATLFEICLNILHGHFKLSPKRYRQFKRERQTLRTLANKKVGLQRKKTLVNQKGGFIGALASFAVPLLAQLLLK